MGMGEMTVEQALAVLDSEIITRCCTLDEPYARDMRRVRDLFATLAVEAKARRGDTGWIAKALASKDWIGPASHFKPDEEVIQTRVLRDLLKCHLSNHEATP